MTLSFYIQSGRKQRKFATASDIDNFIRSNRFKADAMIIMKDETGKVLGSMLVSTYLQKP